MRDRFGVRDFFRGFVFWHGGVALLIFWIVLLLYWLVGQGIERPIRPAPPAATGLRD